MPSDPAKGVFISYRREDGAVLARLVHEAISREEGTEFDIFLDVDHEDSGHFPAKIQQEISDRLHFILVCAGGSLLRPQEGREDWVRKEIECALRLQRHIIPLVGPGFTWPEASGLPFEFHFLSTLQRIHFDNRHWSEPKTGTRSKLIRFLKAGQEQVRRIYETYVPAAEVRASKLEEEGDQFLGQAEKSNDTKDTRDLDEAAKRFREALVIRKRAQLESRSYQTDDAVARVHEKLGRALSEIDPKSSPASRELGYAKATRLELLEGLTNGDPRQEEQALAVLPILRRLAKLNEERGSFSAQKGFLEEAADHGMRYLSQAGSCQAFEELCAPILDQAKENWRSTEDALRSQSIDACLKVVDAQWEFVDAGIDVPPEFMTSCGARVRVVAKRQLELNRHDDVADLLRKPIERWRLMQSSPSSTEHLKSLCAMLELAADAERGRHEPSNSVSYLAESLGHRRAVVEIDATHDDLVVLGEVLAKCIDACACSSGCPAQVEDALRTWHRVLQSRVDAMTASGATASIAEARDLCTGIDVVRARRGQLVDGRTERGADWPRSNLEQWLLQIDPSLASLSDRLRDIEDKDQRERTVRPEEKDKLTRDPRRYQIVTPITKSEFKLGLECVQKLRHARLGLPRDAAGDGVQLLAEGGAAVESLQRAIEPGTFLGHSARNDAAFESLRRVREAVQAIREGASRQSIYQVTIEIDGFHARLDLVRLFADRIELVDIEAKRKPLDGMLTRRGTVRILWLPILQDVAFQHQLLRQWVASNRGTLGISPDLPISARLLLLDPDGVASDADVFDRTNFRMVHLQGSRGVRATVEYVGKRPPATSTLLCEIPVDEELALVQANTGSSVDCFKNRGVAECMAAMRNMVDSDCWPEPSESLGVKCKECEFHARDRGQSGFERCWGMPDFPPGHVAELMRVSDGELRTAVATLGQDAKIADLPRESISPTQLPQWRVAASGRPEVDSGFAADPIAAMVPAGCTGPVWFLDFETAAYPIPRRIGGRPYEAVPFQFEGHLLPNPGSRLLERVRLPGFLDLETSDPRRGFVDALREQLGTEGPIFHWSAFEPSVLGQLRAQFNEDPQAGDEDRLAFICSLLDPDGPGAGRLVDLSVIAKNAFYHPALRGSRSIKRVVPIAWAEPSIRDAFEIGHGAAGDPDSYSGDEDPYQGLAAAFADAPAHGSGSNPEASAIPTVPVGDVIRNGSMAMLAYHHARLSDEPHHPAIARQLRRYCGLDSAAVVMVYGLMRDVVRTWPHVGKA
jgi:hypothetical protein